jgi:hypothetical protein
MPEDLEVYLERNGDLTPEGHLWRGIEKSFYKGIEAALKLRHPDINAKNDESYTPLHKALRKEDVQIVGLLLAHGADPCLPSGPYDETPLMWAAMLSERYVRPMLEHTRDVNGQAPDGRTALHYAILGGDPLVVKLLLAKGAEVLIPNNSGQTPLDLAREQGSDELARLLECASSVQLGRRLRDDFSKGPQKPVAVAKPLAFRRTSPAR